MSLPHEVWGAILYIAVTLVVAIAWLLEARPKEKK